MPLRELPSSRLRGTAGIGDDGAVPSRAVQIMVALSDAYKFFTNLRLPAHKSLQLRSTRVVGRYRAVDEDAIT